MTAFSGVRSSCDMLARNSDLCWLGDLELPALLLELAEEPGVVDAPATDWLAKVSSRSDRVGAERAGRAAGGRRARRGSRPRAGAGRQHRAPARRACSTSRCGVAGARPRCRRAAVGSPLGRGRRRGCRAAPMRVRRSASTSSWRSCRRPSARENSRPPASNSKIDPPSVPESSTAWLTIVASTSCRSRLELTAWLTSPQHVELVDRAGELGGGLRLRNSRTFSTAMAPCAAKVSTTSIARVRERGDLAGATPDHDRRPPRSGHIGTPSIVRKPPSRLRAACQAYSGSAAASLSCSVRRSSATRPVSVSGPGAIGLLSRSVPVRRRAARRRRRGGRRRPSRSWIAPPSARTAARRSRRSSRSTGAELRGGAADDGQDLARGRLLLDRPRRGPARAARHADPASPRARDAWPPGAFRSARRAYAPERARSSRLRRPTLERVAQVARAPGVDGDDVEAHVGRPSRGADRPAGARRSAAAALPPPADGLLAAPGAARLHLDEHQRPPRAGQDVDLAGPAHAHVAGQHAHARGAAGARPRASRRAGPAACGGARSRLHPRRPAARRAPARAGGRPARRTSGGAADTARGRAPRRGGAA